MNYKTYQPEIWRNDDGGLDADDAYRMSPSRSDSKPAVFDRSLLLELLGRINYQIVSGNRIYVEAGGVVYRALYGGYWRSVFTGIEHYSIKCEEISGAVWADGRCASVVDLPVIFANNCWSASGHSLSFMLARDSAAVNLDRGRWHSVLHRRVKAYRERTRARWC